MSAIIGRIVEMKVSFGEVLDFEVAKIKRDMFDDEIVWLDCVDFGAPRESMPLQQFINMYGA